VSAKDLLDMQDWDSSSKDTAIFPTYLCQQIVLLAQVLWSEDKRLDDLDFVKTPLRLIGDIIDQFVSACKSKRLEVKTFAFFVDECHELLREVEGSDRTLFHYFRLAMNLMPKDKELKFVFAVLDTFGAVANYVPTDVRDPSLRMVVGNQLFPPFNWFPFQDYKELALGNFRGKQKFKDLCMFGRFLWRIDLDSTSIMALAKYKITGFLDSRDASFETQRQASLALLVIRTSSHFLANDKLALDLVNSNGAYLNYVTDDRKVVNVSYPNDPVLSFNYAN
jgi:hypothetical protein